MMSDSLIDVRMRAVSVLVGLNNDTGAVVANTVPIPLLPGVHLLGSFGKELRRELDRPGLAALGYLGVGYLFSLMRIY